MKRRALANRSSTKSAVTRPPPCCISAMYLISSFKSSVKRRRYASPSKVITCGHGDYGMRTGLADGKIRASPVAPAALRVYVFLSTLFSFLAVMICLQVSNAATIPTKHRLPVSSSVVLSPANPWHAVSRDSFPYP